MGWRPIFTGKLYRVLAINDVGDGLCYKHLYSDDPNGAGVARFSDPEGEDDRHFVVPSPTDSGFKVAAINNVGDAVVTVGYGSQNFAYVEYAGGVATVIDGYIADINDSGAFIVGVAAINNNGETVGLGGVVQR